MNRALKPKHPVGKCVCKLAVGEPRAKTAGRPMSSGTCYNIQMVSMYTPLILNPPCFRDYKILVVVFRLNSVFNLRGRSNLKHLQLFGELLEADKHHSLPDKCYQNAKKEEKKNVIQVQSKTLEDQRSQIDLKSCYINLQKGLHSHFFKSIGDPPVSRDYSC